MILSESTARAAKTARLKALREAKEASESEPLEAPKRQSRRKIAASARR